ncbi:MAG: glycosyltransferase [Planctomycetota bacterium]|nr:glycosyltransferase [Planctomycetota bacterium]
MNIIVVTYNAQPRLAKLLAGLQSQSQDNEILIIDSSSTDSTSGIAAGHGVRILTIRQSDFDHGGTRNLGIEQTSAEFIVFMTQDTICADEHAVAELIRPLREDENIAAVYGRQTACDDASVFARHLRLFNYPETSYVRGLDDRKKYGIKTAFLSNSFAAYRTSVLREIGGFKSGLIFGEDTFAAAKILLKGKKIAYAADAKVFHSHNYTPRQEFKRYFDMGVFHKCENWLLREFGKAERHGSRYAKSEIKFLLKQRKIYLLPEFILRIIMKYLGYKLGTQYAYLPKSINRLCSMNPAWWDKKIT